MHFVKWLLFWRADDHQLLNFDLALRPLAERLVSYGILLCSIVLIGGAIERVLQGKREWWPVVWWAAAMWAILLLGRVGDTYSTHSPQHRTVIIIMVVFGLVWAAYGIWRIIPMMIREWRAERSKKGGQCQS